jgi:hypothetical protein
MCQDNCEHPELKPKYDKCSEEQIKKCYGNEEDHPCDYKNNKYNN